MTRKYVKKKKTRAKSPETLIDENFNHDKFARWNQAGGPLKQDGSPDVESSGSEDPEKSPKPGPSKARSSDKGSSPSSSGSSKKSGRSGYRDGLREISKKITYKFVEKGLRV